MTESKAETAPKPVKELLALNPKQESEFKKKVQEAKKNKSSKVGRDEKCGTETTTNSRCESVLCFYLFIFYFLQKLVFEQNPFLSDFVTYPEVSASVNATANLFLLVFLLMDCCALKYPLKLY